MRVPVSWLARLVYYSWRWRTQEREKEENVYDSMNNVCLLTLSP